MEYKTMALMFLFLMLIMAFLAGYFYSQNKALYRSVRQAENIVHTMAKIMSDLVRVVRQEEGIDISKYMKGVDIHDTK